MPPTAWATRAAKAADYREAADLVETDGMAAFVEAGRLASRPPATMDTPETMPEVSEELLPSLLRGAALTDLPAATQLTDVAVPTTILAWTDDPAHPVSTAEALAGLLPHSRLEVARTPADLATWPEILTADVARHD